MRFRPSLFDVIFVIWAITIPIGFGPRLLNSDGDVARHLRLGETMLRQGAVLRQDAFSHTANGKPFLAFEWGSETLYATAHRAFGLAGVVVLAGLVLALTYALLARWLIARGGEPFLAYVVSTVAALLSAAHWLARPHLFTMLLVVVLLHLLTHPRARWWHYALLFAIWANLHGGFFYGCVLIALYTVGEAAEATLSGDRATWLSRARHHAGALVVAVLASLVNPYGVKLPLHVANFFGNSAILTQTQEFQSPDFHTINAKIFLVVLASIIAALALSRRRPPLPVLVVLLANIGFALISQRNIELFALAALPLVVLHLDPEWRALPVLRRPRAVFEREHRGSHSGLAAGLVTLLLVGLAFAGGSVGGISVIPNAFDAKTFPVAAVARARAAGLQDRLFNEFTWGGYLLYAWPEQRVFIDGGTDFYGEALFRQYVQIWNLDPGWREVMRRWNLSMVLVPPRSRLAHELVRDRQWSIWYCDSTAAVLRLAPAISPSLSSSPDQAETALGRCGTSVTAQQ